MPFWSVLTTWASTVRLADGLAIDACAVDACACVPLETVLKSDYKVTTRPTSLAARMRHNWLSHNELYDYLQAWDRQAHNLKVAGSNPAPATNCSAISC